jgi:hypothetical protein
MQLPNPMTVCSPLKQFPYITRDVYGLVRIAMVRLSHVHQGNSKGYFVNQNVCTNARITCIIRGVKCY